METKFTPGPWAFDRGDCGEEFSVPYCQVTTIDGDLVVAEINDKISVEIGRANGMLIAAAPDLYEALTILMQWIKGWDPNFIYDDEWPDDADKARAALAKARGES